MSNNELCHVETTSFRHKLGDAAYPKADKRYWLFTAKLCPFAQRTEIVRSYLGLENTIGITIADAVQTEKGWDLMNTHAQSTINPLPHIRRAPALYALASPGYDGRASVPILFDKQTETIVNNESADIILQLDKVFNTGGQLPSLYPKNYQSEIDKVAALLKYEFINPIYVAGFAKEQTQYDENVVRVFDALDTLEKRLSNNKGYLVSDHITLADIHAFPHLVRFDAIYHCLYRLNHRYIRDYPNISDYVTALSTVKGFGDTLDIDETKRGYFMSWNQPTARRVVPRGPSVDKNTGIAL